MSDRESALHLLVSAIQKKNQKTLSPTNKELADGQNWELVNDGSEEPKYINHKAIPIARIISKGRA